MTVITKIIALVLLTIPAQAQFRLSGKIDQFNKSTLFVNIPYVFGYYKENNISIPVNTDGSFDVMLPIQKEKFVLLNYNEQEFCLYMRPNETLHVFIDSTGKNITPESGSLLPENEILTACNLYEYPWFLQNHLSEDSAAVLSKEFAGSIYRQFTQPWLNQTQQKEALVSKSTLPERTKQLFIQEIKAYARCRANEFAWNFMGNQQLSAFYKLLYGSISPRPVINNPGPMYYMFVRYYNGFLESDAMEKMKTGNIQPNGPLPYYNISLDSGNVIVKKKGKAYLNWLAVKNTNDAFVAEAFLAQQLFSAITDKDITIARELLTTLANTYPNSQYHNELENRFDELENILLRNANNNNIRIFDGYKNVQSIYTVINSLKGKVVYLDVWGTWCGPCKAELKHAPELKAYFKDKDVAFVYLDMDEEEKDAAWKDFIKVNELWGTHLRKNSNEIEAFWKELLANDPDKTTYYPQYFIFDKKGKLVITKAKRPSEGPGLYEQIESVLNQ